MKRHLILGLFAGLLAIAPAEAGLFGDSDEEKAMRQHEKDQDASIRDLTDRIHDLEETLRQTTGQNEVLAHQIQQLGDKINRQQKDFEYRLCTLSAQQLGAAQSEDGSEPALNCGNGGGQVSQRYNPAPQQQPQQPGITDNSSVVRLSPPPGVLGTLPAKNANGGGTPASPQARSQFNAALDMAAKQRYDEARSAFRAFADGNPDDEMAPQAVYWVGNIAFLQKDYAGAAHTFAEEIKKYPTSSRAPDSMLKLGQSLIALGQTKEGCLALGALPGKYPNASKTVAAQAANERKTSCR